MTDSSSDIFTIEKCGNMVMKCVFDTLYKHGGSRSDGGRLTMKQWIKKFKISENQLKKTFQSEKKCIFVEKHPVDFDSVKTDIYYKLIKLVIDNCYSDQFDKDFNEYLEKIRTFYIDSKHVVHGSAVCESNYDTKKWLGLFKSVLKTVEDNLGIDIYTCKLLKQLPKLMQNITKSNKIFLEKAYKEISGKVQQLKHRIIQKDYKSDIPEDIFTEPELSCNEKKLELKDLFNTTEEENNLIFLIGPAGCGKSTVCAKLFQEWLDKKVNNETPTSFKITPWDLVVFIRLRNYRSSKLIKFLQNSYLPKTVKELDISLEDFDKYFNDLSVLFLLDGYDEVGDDCDIVKDISKIIQIKKNKRIQVLVSTRSDKLKQAVQNFNHSKSKIVNLFGFDENARKEYAEKFLSNYGDSPSEKEKQELFTFLEDSKSALQDHLKLPLTLCFVILLWCNWDHDSIKLRMLHSVTKLFMEIIEMMKKKMLKSRIGSSIHNLGEENWQRIYNLFISCANNQLSEQNFKLELSEKNYKKLNELCNEDKFPIEEFCSALLDGNPHDEFYTFFHKTQMEYLAGEYIVKQLDDEGELTSSVNTLSRHHNYVLPFVVGHLTINKKLDDYTQQVIDCLTDIDTDIVLLYNLLVESQEVGHLLDPNCDKPFCKKIAQKVIDHVNFDSKNVTKGLEVLSHCNSNKLKSITITLEESDIDNSNWLSRFESTFEKLKTSFRIKKPSEPIEVSLHILCNKISSQAACGRILEYLNPWAKLLHFTGYIGSSSIKPLCQATSIKRLSVKISSLDVYEQLNEKCLPKFKYLSSFTIEFLGLKNFQDVAVNQIKIPKSPDVLISFIGISSDTLHCALQLLHKIISEDVLIKRLSFPNSSLKMDDAMTIVDGMEKLRPCKICVMSSNSIHYKRQQRFAEYASKNHPNIVFEWNHQEINYSRKF